MQTLQTTFHPAYAASTNTNIFSRFISWCKGQEKNHFGWVGAILTVHGCILVPISMYCIFTTGFSLVLCTVVLGSMAVSLITNLAALPTKYTIPVFFLSALIDLAVIGICLAQLFN